MDGEGVGGGEVAGEGEDVAGGLEGADDGTDEVDDEQRAKVGEGDVIEAGSPAGAVEFGGLVEILGNALEGGEVDEHAGPHAAPDADKYDGGNAPDRMAEPVHGLTGDLQRGGGDCIPDMDTAEPDLVDQAVGGGLEEALPEQEHDDAGDDRGQIIDGAQEVAERADLVHQDGEHDGGEKAEADAEGHVVGGLEEGGPGGGVGEDLDEIGGADPGGGAGDAVILEGDGEGLEDGVVGEDADEKQGGRKEGPRHDLVAGVGAEGGDTGGRGRFMEHGADGVEGGDEDAGDDHDHGDDDEAAVFYA